MSIVILIAVLFIGGWLAWVSDYIDSALPRYVALGTVVIDLLILLFVYFGGSDPVSTADVTTGLLASSDQWISQINLQWIPRFGISFHLGVDGLSLVLMLLTLFLGVIACGSAWNEITTKTGFFYFNLLWTLAGVIGVFTALDLFLFFFFWEVMLIPMYFIIAIWGHENKSYASMKFFIFTQVSGMLMLVSILVLSLFHYKQFGFFSFDYFDLLKVNLDSGVAMWVMLGFFIAFTTKLPSVPFHAWLPDAHSQAPTAGSVILAGVLLKTGAYGLIRFAVPLFPQASADFAPIAMTLAVISILYCAKVAFAQTDIKRLIAYTSVSHMGFVTLGVYAWNTQALQGAVMTMLAHGLSAAALFMLAGGLQHRIHTRNLNDMGGFWAIVPRMSAVLLFFSVAAVGMPGLGNFVGEFLSLLGAFKANIVLTALAALGLVLAAVYTLWVIQKAFHGEINRSALPADGKLADLSARELLYYGAMIIGLVWMGMYPQTFLNITEPPVLLLQSYTDNIISAVAQTQTLTSVAAGQGAGL